MRLLPIIIFLFSLAISIDANAQCVMCKAVAESALENGASAPKGINNGIIYLMGVPYLLLLTIGVVLFRKPLATKLKSITK